MVNILSFLGFFLAAAGAGLAHFRIASPQFGFFITLGGVLLMGLLFFPALISLFRRGWGGVPAFSLVVGLFSLVGLGFLVALALKSPLNDLTTDITNPPKFTHLAFDLPLSAENIKELDPSFAIDKSYSPTQKALQVEYFPDLSGFKVEAPFQKVIPLMEKGILEQLPDWKVVVHDSKTGRLEFEVESPLFRFVDDVVIEARPDKNPNDTVVHMRSRSRVGKSDLGANAKRIQDLKIRLQIAVEPAVQEDAPRRLAEAKAIEEKKRKEQEEIERKRKEEQDLLNAGKELVSPTPPPPPPPKPDIPLAAPPSPYEEKK